MFKRANPGTENDTAPTDAPPKFVVGIGASAGGVQALEQLFSTMPVDTGCAFVVVTHLQENQKSFLSEILGRRTAMPVEEVTAEVKPAPDHVYVQAADHPLLFRDGLLVTGADGTSGSKLPIDALFRSLASQHKQQAIAIVLSGAGSDGALGIKEIKAELGMVMAQQEQSASFAGMPHSAIITGLVDYVMPAHEMARQLVHYIEHWEPQPPHETDATDDQSLPEVFALLRSRTGHDLTGYKRSTIQRRIDRRRALHGHPDVPSYVQYLKNHPTEVELLFKELLIGVTSFFRDPEAFEALRSGLQDALTNLPAGYVFRAWVAACSTGEEAYSVAIVLHECLANRSDISLQIFATDLESSAVDVARMGCYPHGIVHDVSAERLARFFVLDGDQYRVRTEVRQSVIFAPHNILDDPPFTRLDLVSCRNLLIYLDASLQKRLLPMFHYALREGGLLFLGTSESLGTSSGLFSTKDKRWRLFERRAGLMVPKEFAVVGPRLTERRPPFPAGLSRERPSSAHSTERLILEEWLPPTLLVTEKGDVVHILGRTGQFLEPAAGPQPAANIYGMAKEGLHLTLHAAIRQAQASDDEVIHPGVRVQADGRSVLVDLRVQRIREREAYRGLFLVVFDRAREVPEAPPEDGAPIPQRVSELERELHYTQQTHRGTVEDLETANEELKSSVEELQSTNEELQSANEELETSKEEMQSLNEEMHTINVELEEKVDELSRANDDMKNLLNATDIATLFLDNQLNIKSYTEEAKQVVRLIPSDVGRPLSDLAPRLRYTGFVEDAREVLRTLVPKESEVRGEGGEWYLIRMTPYRTRENIIDGLVTTFVDVTSLRSFRRGQRLLAEIVDRSPMAILGVDGDLVIRWGHGRPFGRAIADQHGRPLGEVFDSQTAEKLRDLVGRVREKGQALRERFQVGDPSCSYDLYIEPLRDDASDMTGFSIVLTELQSSG